MPNKLTRDVHAERERQHRRWADEADHPAAKKSHLEMAKLHAQAGRSKQSAAAI